MASAFHERAEAAAALVAALREMEERGRNIVTTLVAEAPFVELRHYPEDDVIDHKSHAQYYLHAHRGGRESAHIHCFMRATGIPDGVHPLGSSADDADSRTMTHVLAVSLDGNGRPAGLFTTNRWVTGDEWHAAETLVSLLPGMTWRGAKGPRPVNRALTALFVLYRQAIVALLRRRDRKIAAWASRHPGENAFEDREIEVLSTAQLNLERTLADLRERLDD